MKSEAFPLLFPSKHSGGEGDSLQVVSGMITEKDLNSKGGTIIPLMLKLARQNVNQNHNAKIAITSKFLQQTQLMHQLKSDIPFYRTLTLTNICNSSASLLQFEDLKRGCMLYRINDLSLKCYILINGRLNVFKQKYINNVLMTALQYLNYLLYLKQSDELFLLSDTMKKNYFFFPIDKIEDLPIINRLAFLIEVKANIVKEQFDLERLNRLFKEYNLKYDSFRISSQDLQRLWFNKKVNIEHSQENWVRYLNEHFIMTQEEMAFFIKYSLILKEKDKKEWICTQYELQGRYGRGAFFGEAELNCEDNTRKVSVMAEEDCLLASFTREDYRLLIEPKDKKEKPKEMHFLNENFFFRAITLYVFEKNYFHNFTQLDLKREHLLYENGSEPSGLYFLKEGSVETTIQCSVIDLHNLLCYLIEKITTLPLFCQGSIRFPPIMNKDKSESIKEFLQDSVLSCIKNQGKDFIREMNRLQVFHLFHMSENEVLGIEETVLDIPYLTTARVNSLTASFLALQKEDLNKILLEEQASYYLYSKFSLNKIISLIERLYHLKKNSIDLALYKRLQNEESLKLNNPYYPNRLSVHQDLIPSLPKGGLKEKMQKIAKDELKAAMQGQGQGDSVPLPKPEQLKKSSSNTLNTKQRIIVDINSYLSSQEANSFEENKLSRNNTKTDREDYVNFNNKYVSIQNLKRDMTNFSSVEKSRRLVEMVMKPTDFEMLKHNTSQYNYSKYPKDKADKVHQSMFINELVRSNFPLSYVNLINSKNKSFSNPMSVKDASCECNTDRKVNCSFIDKAKIPFIAHRSRKQLIRSKGATRNSSCFVPSIGTLNDYVPLSTKAIQLDKKVDRKINVLNEVVKEYYDGIKRKGYSLLAKGPYNSYIKVKKVKSQSHSSRNILRNQFSHP